MADSLARCGLVCSKCYRLSCALDRVWPHLQPQNSYLCICFWRRMGDTGSCPILSQADSLACCFFLLNICSNSPDGLCCLLSMETCKRIFQNQVAEMSVQFCCPWLAEVHVNFRPLSSQFGITRKAMSPSCNVMASAAAACLLPVTFAGLTSYLTRDGSTVVTSFVSLHLISWL